MLLSSLFSNSYSSAWLASDPRFDFTCWCKVLISLLYHKLMVSFPNSVRVIMLEVRVIMLEVRVVILEVRVIILEVRVIMLEVRVIILEVRVIILEVRVIILEVIVKMLEVRHYVQRYVSLC